MREEQVGPEPGQDEDHDDEGRKPLDRRKIQAGQVRSPPDRPAPEWAGRRFLRLPRLQAIGQAGGTAAARPGLVGLRPACRPAWRAAAASLAVLARWPAAA